MNEEGITTIECEKLQLDFLKSGRIGYEELLLDFLKSRCYREGDFTLSSGKKSTYYFDSKMAFMSSSGAVMIGEELYQRTKNFNITALGGPEIGAIPMVVAAAVAYGIRKCSLEGFFVRSEAKGHGAKKLVEGYLQPGQRVGIVDDVVTSGESVMRAVRAVRELGYTPGVVTALVDRQEGAAELFTKEGLVFRPIFTIDQFR